MGGVRDPGLPFKASKTAAEGDRGSAGKRELGIVLRAWADLCYAVHVRNPRSGRSVQELLHHL